MIHNSRVHIYSIVRLVLCFHVSRQKSKYIMSLSSKTLTNHAAAKVHGKVLFFLRLYFKSPISPPPVDDTEKKGGGDRKSRSGGGGGLE